ILSRQQRDDVESHLQYFLELDPFVVNLSEKKYWVRSLYYDTDDYAAFHDKIDGLMLRHKFRIRTYKTEPEGDAPVFLEVKGRNNNLVYKHRTPVDVSSWENYRGSALSQYVLAHAVQGAVSDNFAYSLMRHRIKPVAVIDYRRRAYISKYDASFRLTFDDSLYGYRTDRVFPAAHAPRRSVLSGYTILEIKFHRHVPAWFHRVIQAHQLKRQSVSKICRGMEVLDMVYDES
ncbi:MAG: polyphosphate polymerase domain-containing protein, partial [Haliea sp.]